MPKKIKVIILGSGYSALQELPRTVKMKPRQFFSSPIEKDLDKNGMEQIIENPILSNLYAYGTDEVHIDSVSIDFVKEDQRVQIINENAFKIAIKRISKDIGNFYIGGEKEVKVEALQGNLDMMEYWEQEFSSSDYDGVVVINGDGDGNVEPLFQSYRKANKGNVQVLFLDWCTCCMEANSANRRDESTENISRPYGDYRLWGAGGYKTGETQGAGKHLMEDMRAWDGSLPKDGIKARLSFDPEFKDICRTKLSEHLERLQMENEENATKQAQAERKVQLKQRRQSDSENHKGTKPGF